MRIVAAVLCIGSVAALAVACGEDQPACFAGDFRACRCNGGASGYQACDSASATYGVCVCDGRTPGVDAAISDGSIEDVVDAALDTSFEAGSRELYATCNGNEDCASGLCFDFRALGRRCTKPCADPSECPSPSTACNQQGVCRPP